MLRISTLLVPALALAIATDAGAQPGAGPMPGPMPGAASMAGPLGDPAAFFLARTGELRLADAQVTRLAAITRRASERRTAMRTRMDSLRVANRPSPDGAVPSGRPSMEAMRASMERERDQSHVDLRDALAVLTADQQARAWELAMRGGPGGRRMEGARPARDRDRAPGRARPGGNRGPGGPGGPGAEER